MDEARPNSSGPPPAPGPARRPLPWLRWGLLAALLLAEAMAVSVTFDAAARADDPGWAGTVVTWIPSVFRWALVVGGAAVVLGVWFLGDAIRGAAAERHAPGALAVWVLGQLGAYAGFVFVTSRVLAPEALETPLSPGALAIWLVAAALTGLLWAAAVLPGRAWGRLLWDARFVLAAAAAVGVVTSLVARVSREGWEILSAPTMWAAHAALRVLTPETVYEPAALRLGTPRFTVTVGVPCSGYEGMGLITAYLGGYLYLFRRDLRFPHALFLLPLGLVAVWLVNVARIAVLIVIGDRVSPDLAMGGFHSQAGWLGFNVVALTLLYLTHRSHLFVRHPAPPAEDGHPTAAYLSPLLAGVAVQMLTVAFSPNPEVLYPLRAVAAGGLLWYFWGQYRCLRTAGRGGRPAAPTGAHGTAWAVAIGALVFLVWVALVPLGRPADEAADPARAFGGLPTWVMAGWFAAKVVGFVIVTPLAEELAFRGYLMRRLIAADFEHVPPARFTWLSFLGSSVLFGLLHGQWLAGTLAGMGYAAVAYRTGRVRDAVVAHAVTNGLLLAVMAATENWQE